jgi:hypothetical protein
LGFPLQILLLNFPYLTTNVKRSSCFGEHKPLTNIQAMSDCL